METIASFKRGSFDYGIENKGVGPAVIKELEYIYKEFFYDNTNEVFLALFGENTRGVGFSGTGKDYVFKSGEAISLLSINLPDSLINEITYRWENDSVNLKITYSDVYGNCWKFRPGCHHPSFIMSQLNRSILKNTFHE